MTDLYSEWRDFYAEKVRSWMSLEELRAECGKLQTVDNPSPEVLLIHAMHALEELQAEVDVLKAESARLRDALQAIVGEVSDGLVPYSSDSYLPAHLVEQARAALE